MSAQPIIALVGNPNAGKTQLFNHLTGRNDTVGNWPGVTVDCQSAQLSFGKIATRLVDLPGCYSLNQDMNTAIDNQITCEFMADQSVDLIINVMDATHLSRQCYLSCELLEIQRPMIIVLTKIDLAHKERITLDPASLQTHLGCPVLTIQPDHAQDLKKLKRAIEAALKNPSISQTQIVYPEVIEHAITQISDLIPDTIKHPKRLCALKLLEGDTLFPIMLPVAVRKRGQELGIAIECDRGDPADLLIADARYARIASWKSAPNTTEQLDRVTRSTSAKIDHVLLNRWLGLPFFFVIMYLLFTLVIGIGGAMQGVIEHLTNVGLMQTPKAWLIAHHAPSWIISLGIDGLALGLSTTLTFIPVVGLMFIFLSWLEDCGYMARAAFVTDRLMRAAGLPGKAFVAMIVGLGCNVPAVMATRTLDHKQDRILTSIMTPFMSCSARLAIYAVFVAAFFPRHGGLVIFTLYTLGIVIAICSGLLLRRTLVSKDIRPLIMELPNYQLPGVKPLLKTSGRRLSAFLKRAGKAILPISLVLVCLTHMGTEGRWHAQPRADQSALAHLSKQLAPVFHPMGLNAQNWPAVAGLFTGVVSKEVVIGSLNTLYANLNPTRTKPTHVAHHQVPFLTELKAQIMTIPSAILHPFINVPDGQISSDATHHMIDRFGNKAAAFAYLVFILLYFPCVSTLAAQRREIGLAWTSFSLAWSTGIAYAMATVCYQLAIYSSAPSRASSVLLTTGLILASGFFILRIIGRQSAGGRT